MGREEQRDDEHDISMTNGSVASARLVVTPARGHTADFSRNAGSGRVVIAEKPEWRLWHGGGKDDMGLTHCLTGYSVTGYNQFNQFNPNPDTC